MQLEDVTKISLLFDKYKNLLTVKQCMVIESYINNDMSLSEVAEVQNISRQAVNDNLKRTINILYDYENKLGLIKKQNETFSIADKMKLENSNEELINRLYNIWED